jgi:MOSC domain-containing protein YiiM
MNEVRRLSLDELQAGLDHIRRSPGDRGTVVFIVRRPETLKREVIAEAQLDLALGLVGDNWKARGYRKSPDGSAHPDMQITVMNARVIALLAETQDRWALAGDQLYVDLDLSVDNLPPGTRLAVGTAVIEVTAEPHTGCRQFSDRFGTDATRFVNSPEGKQLRLRGLNAKVVQAGAVRVGDVAIKLPVEAC